MDTNSTPDVPTTMRAARQRTYGGSEVLRIEEVAVPTPTPGTVLVEVAACALNPLDWHLMTGTPWLMRLQSGFRTPKRTGVGIDVAGRVVAVANDVTTYSVGDAVMGAATGSWGEYVLADIDRVVAKPEQVTFEVAGSIGVAGMTALQGLRDKAVLEAGQHVLVNGASGGVGLAAVQLAKWMGAEVTGVCSGRNVSLVEKMGADHVIDYTVDDFTTAIGRYDVVFDNQGNRSIRDTRRVLAEDGVYLLVGGPKNNRAFGPALRMVRAFARFAFASQRVTAFVADERISDIQILADLMASGDLRVEIERTYDLDDIATAMDHLADGHVRGKIALVQST